MKQIIWTQMAALLIVALFTETAHSTDTITVTGTVTDDYELVDEEGDIYLIVEAPLGRQFVESAGSTVTVTGTIKEGEDDSDRAVRKFEAHRISSYHSAHSLWPLQHIAKTNTVKKRDG